MSWQESLIKLNAWAHIALILQSEKIFHSGLKKPGFEIHFLFASLKRLKFLIMQLDS